MAQKVDLARNGSHVAERIGGEIHSPGVEGRLEINERDVVRPLVHRRRVLEGGDDHPVDRNRTKNDQMARNE